MKNINELRDNNNSAWRNINEWINDSESDVLVLQPEKQKAEETLYMLQVSTKSVLGAVVYETAGILINNGWLRIYGSGNSTVKSIVERNKLDSDGVSTLYKGILLIADDVVGGFFALNAGALEGKPGNIFYLAPDTLEWEDLELSYSQFVQWSFSQKLNQFYENFQWTNWQKDVEKVDINHGILIYPFLWAEGAEIDDRIKKIVPIDEIWELTINNMCKVHK